MGKKHININSTVEVILTKAGAKIINEDNSDFIWRHKKCSITFPIYKEGDVYRSQLWSIMSLFGKYIFAGAEAPFSNCDIIVDECNVRDNV